MRSRALDLRTISQEIIDAIADIEKETGNGIMFGAVGGSYSLGLQNSSSDIDCYLIVDNNQLSDVIHTKANMTIQGEQELVDFMCVSYQEILREIQRYCQLPKRYPTVLHRTEEEKQRNVGKKDVERPDFKRSVLFRVLLSDEIIYKEHAESRTKEFANGIRIIDIIDYHYTRIYGNYVNQVKDREYVPIRKYLYLIHEISTCKCLMTSNRKPPMDYINLINCMITDPFLKESAYVLYEKNKCVVKDKKEELVHKKDLINHFIVSSMTEIYDYLNNHVSDHDQLFF